MYEAAALLWGTCSLNVNVQAARGSRCCGSPLQSISTVLQGTVHEQCELHERQGWLLMHADLQEAGPCGLHHIVTVAAGQDAGGHSHCCRSMCRGLGPLLQTFSSSSNALHAHAPASLLQVNVQVEIKDDKTAIPRNSLIEANQSGLIAESLIDITPQQPVPQYKVGTCLGAPPGRCRKQMLSLRPSRGSHSDVRASIASSSQACCLPRAAQGRGCAVKLSSTKCTLV